MTLSRQLVYFSFQTSFSQLTTERLALLKFAIRKWQNTDSLAHDFLEC